MSCLEYKILLRYFSRGAAKIESAANAPLKWNSAHPSSFSFPSHHPSSLLLPPTLILGLREYSYDIEKRPRRTPKPKRAAKDVPSNRLSTYSIRSLVNSCTVLCIGNHCHSNRVGYQIRYTYRLFSTFAFCE